MKTLTGEQVAQNGSDVLYLIVIIISVLIVGWTLLHWNRRR